MKKTLAAILAGSMLAATAACIPDDCKRACETITCTKAYDAYAQEQEALFSAKAGELKCYNEVLKDAKASNVVYCSELHNSSDGHEFQAKLLKGLYAANPSIVVFMEMFQANSQKTLDSYLGSEMSEDEFLKKVDWNHTWGFDYKFYKPIIDFAKEKKLKIIAMDAPLSIVRKVARQGLEALTEEEKAGLPHVKLDNERYRSIIVDELKRMHDKMAKMDDAACQRYYEAFCLRNDVMAGNILKNTKNGEKAFVIVGAGHADYIGGVPKRVAEQSSMKSLILAPYALCPEEEESKNSEEGKSYDFDAEYADYYYFIPEPKDE